MIISIEYDETGKPNVVFNNGNGHDPASRKKGKSLLAFTDSFVVIDLETTGFDPYYNEIIEMSAIKVESGTQTAIFSELVKPSVPVSTYITELTGITNDMLYSRRNISEVLPDFISFVGSSIIVGHNVNFDINFIYDNLIKLTGDIFKNDFIDTMRLSQKLLPDLKNRKLVTLAKHYNVSPTISHRSLSDCETTTLCYTYLMNDALEKYGSLENFKNSFQKIHKHVSAKDITSSNNAFDETHPLYGKVCCFTGALESMQRKDAMQLVVDLGGSCSDSITKKTNYLILGNTDYCSNVKGDKTSKTIKAEKAKLSGQDIEIISENVFLDMINQ
ncbi:MAG: exonuclease [Lachnospiraceae bacterium]|nr:exonuclease [Lachnospiraceae bacterium]MBD5506009.1 exonuclease [Lachnospiraceae bacterium]